MSEGQDGEYFDTPWGVEELIALERIKSLKAKYFQAVDEKDYGTLEAIFTSDALVDFSGEIEHRIGHQGVTSAADPAEWRAVGGRATAQVIAASVRNLVTVHQGHDPQIEFMGRDTARGRWPMQDIIEFDGETMIGYGVYSEEYRLRGGLWRISRLRLDRFRVSWESP